MPLKELNLFNCEEIKGASPHQHSLDTADHAMLPQSATLIVASTRHKSPRFKTTTPKPAVRLWLICPSPR